MELTLFEIRKIYERKGINLLDVTTYAAVVNTRVGYWLCVDAYNLLAAEPLDLKKATVRECDDAVDVFRKAMADFFLSQKITIPPETQRMAEAFDEATKLAVLKAMFGGDFTGSSRKDSTTET
jgi:hypothetical protein